MKELVELVRRVAELERRLASTERHGTVVQVDTSNGKHAVRLRLGGEDGEPFLSPWVPYAQIAGALKVHSPPSIGQEMTLLSPGGDFRQAVALPLSWSDQNPSPSDKGDENVITFGDFRAELRGNELTIEVPRLFVKCGGTTFELTGDGLKMVAADYQFD